MFNGIVNFINFKSFVYTFVVSALVWGAINFAFRTENKVYDFDYYFEPEEIRYLQADLLQQIDNNGGLPSGAGSFRFSDYVNRFFGGGQLADKKPGCGWGCFFFYDHNLVGDPERAWHHAAKALTHDILNPLAACIKSVDPSIPDIPRCFSNFGPKLDADKSTNLLSEALILNSGRIEQWHSKYPHWKIKLERFIYEAGNFSLNGNNLPDLTDIRSVFVGLSKSVSTDPLLGQIRLASKAYQSSLQRMIDNIEKTKVREYSFIGAIISFICKILAVSFILSINFGSILSSWNSNSNDTQDDVNSSC